MARALGLLLLLVAGAAVAASAQSLPDKEKCRSAASSNDITTLAPCANGPSVSKQQIAGAEGRSGCARTGLAAARTAAHPQPEASAIAPATRARCRRDQRWETQAIQAFIMARCFAFWRFVAG